MAEQDQRISEVVKREGSRLRNFIRRRVPDPRDAEDILQDVFYELVEANRLLMPIEHVTAWLFRVARNRIIDLFRKRKPESFSDATIGGEEGELLRIEDLLPSPHAGPEAVYVRNTLLEELELALDELPDEQREVFIAHELEGRSFKEMAEDTGVSVNTLLSRKRYAVLRLRESLRRIYEREGLNMRRRWIWIAPLAVLAIPLFIFIGGEIVMHLWNWLLPLLFGWRLITFWQALGLLLLCRILFGGWGGSGGGKGHMRHHMRERMAARMGERMRERWEKMTPEEREKFRQGLRGCMDPASPDAKTSA